MKFIPGDPNKASLKARGLDFETILSAIAEGIVEIYPNPKFPGQIVLVAEINGYMHAIPCEPVGADVWRIITAWPSGKHQKRHKP